MITFHPRLVARTLAVTLSLAALSTAAQAGQINSILQIEGGQTFELGGGQEGAFTVTGTNNGPVAVVLLSKGPNMAAVERGLVAPGGTVDARFAPGEMALLRNTSGSQMARLRLTIIGDTSALGMTYSANP
jgi:hypothetical protein